MSDLNKGSIPIRSISEEERQRKLDEILNKQLPSKPRLERITKSSKEITESYSDESSFINQVNKSEPFEISQHQEFSNKVLLAEEEFFSDFTHINNGFDKEDHDIFYTRNSIKNSHTKSEDQIKDNSYANLQKDQFDTGLEADTDSNNKPSKKQKTKKQRSATARGLKTKNGGFADFIANPPEVQATTFQACGLWPYINGVGTPMVGVPLGHHLYTGSIICSDPISWFSKANLIPNPSLMVTGRPGLGKSTFVRRMALGLCGFGVTPLVFGDLKPDYRKLIEALDGNVIELGRGRGKLNILDPGAVTSISTRLNGASKLTLLEDFRGRRLNVLCAIIALNRDGRVTDHEEAILSTALEILDLQPNPPILPDLIQLIGQGSPELYNVTLTYNQQEYRNVTQHLHRSLVALATGSLGQVFASHTSTSIDLSKPLCVDISGISEADEKLQSAVLLACWGEGFASIAGLQALTDAGLEPQRNFVVILDELWRVLRSGKGMIDRLDALTRLDRASGVGTIMITHTLKDLQGSNQADSIKAKGFAERMGYYAMAGVPQSEISSITELVTLSQSEANLITSWSTPESWDNSDNNSEPPGLGKILLKVGGRPGLPVRVRLSKTELSVNNTNTKWDGKR